MQSAASCDCLHGTWTIMMSLDGVGKWYANTM